MVKAMVDWSGLREDREFPDMTQACEDVKQVEAQKQASLFKNLLWSNTFVRSELRNKLKRGVTN